MLRSFLRPQVIITLAVVGICAANLGAELPSVLLMIGIWGIAGVGLGLVLGYAGQISLCQAAFVGVGAYTYAILTVEHEVPTLVAVVLGAAATGLLAFLVSPMLRIRGYYLAVATIVLNLLLSALAISSLGVPGGASGMAGIPYLEAFGFRLETVEGYAALSLSLLVLFIVGAWARYGRGANWRAIQALRHDEDLASGVGLKVSALKRELFTVSSAAAGLAGTLLAASYGFISPGQFSYGESFQLALAVFIGGSYSLWGAALGVALLHITTPLLGDLYYLHGVLVGIVALLTVRFLPEGWIRRADAVAGVSEADLSVLDRDAEVIADGPTRFPAGGASLALRNVGRSFAMLRAIDEVTLNVKPGKVLGLIGPNGAGKSTLLNLIAGELTPTDGSVALDGQDITRTAPYRRARMGVMRTYQQSRIITSVSVMENILFGTDALRLSGAGKHSHDQLRALAVQAAKDAGAHHLLTKPTESLTFGERRLVELARLLLSQPRVALLDEPLSGLSHLEGEALAAVIQTLRERGTTVVLVEHAIPFVLSLADELVVLQNGRVLAMGLPDEVVALESVQESYLGTVVAEGVS